MSAEGKIPGDGEIIGDCRSRIRWRRIGGYTATAQKKPINPLGSQLEKRVFRFGDYAGEYRIDGAANLAVFI